MHKALAGAFNLSVRANCAGGEAPSPEGVSDFSGEQVANNSDKSDGVAAKTFREASVISKHVKSYSLEVVT